MLRLFEHCPGCGGPLTITECHCAKCQLQLRGEFQMGLFSALSEDQATFIRTFLRARGNLSEVEKVLGVSYPTIRNKLDEINTTLDRAASAPAAGSASGGDVAGAAAVPPEEARQAILAQVADGRLSAAEALSKLQELKGLG